MTLDYLTWMTGDDETPLKSQTLADSMIAAYKEAYATHGHEKFREMLLNADYRPATVDSILHFVQNQN